MNKIAIIAIILLNVVKLSADTIPKNEILNVHNYCREIVGVHKLQWSDTLAQIAQAWADTIAITGQIHHSHNPNYGENLFWSTYRASWKTAIEAWCNEQKYYHGEKITYVGAEKYGHYTQVIWNKTLYVGCGQSKTKGGLYIYVCEYYPPGNFIGQYPYNKKRKK